VRHRPSRKLKAALTRFARAERGATAVEFGLICLPVMVMIFGVIELALVFLVSATLETAVETASRTIRTGAFQQGATPTKAAFKTMVCDKMSWLGAGCADNLYVEARTFANFGAVAANAPVPPVTFVDEDENDDHADDTCWATGQPTDIVLVRTYYRWKLFTPMLNAALENMGGGSGMRLISTTTAFRNEPYSDDPPAGAAC
jgi:Flp pilus assembly protein TadG